MKTAIITVVQGRQSHLRRQVQGIARSTVSPDDYIVVALSDPGAAAVAGDGYVIDIPVTPQGELPLAAARNSGAAAAIERGAELLIFLDVDCIPAPDMVAYYLQAASREPSSLLGGPVSYLPPASETKPLDQLARLAVPHSARPNPDPGELITDGDRRLFWSLSFAVTRQTWQRIGGFCIDYVGYGGEDTDFAETAHAAGVGLCWVGGASAFHQYHSVSSPPVEHLASILRNAHIFYDRWGLWPMTGWLDAFAVLGLARWDEDRGWVAAANRSEVR